MSDTDGQVVVFKRCGLPIWLPEGAATLKRAPSCVYSCKIFCRNLTASSLSLFLSNSLPVFLFPYPVAVEQLDGSEDIKLSSHEELDSQFAGQRWHSMLTGPLVDFLQKLPGSLKQTQMCLQTLFSHNRRGQTGRKWNSALNLIHPLTWPGLWLRLTCGPA